MEPLRIEFKLGRPWVPPAFGTHLDGLIAHLVVKDALAHAFFEEGRVEPGYDALISDLPFERYQSPNGSSWKASKLKAINYHGQERRYMTAKTPVNEMCRGIVEGFISNRGATHIDTSRNYAKNSQIYYTLEHVEQLHAWCIGNRDALELLLAGLTGIGIKTRLGHGALAPFEDGKLFRIVADETAAEKWKNRNLPDQLKPDMYPGVGNTLPPYWKNKSYCWMSCEV